MDDLVQLRRHIMEGDAESVVRDIHDALARAIAPTDIVSLGLIPAMAEVGRKMASREYFIPDVLMSAEAMYAGLNLVRPLLAGEQVRMAGTVILGTVKGDIHSIGKGLVGMMLEGGGFKVIDLGVDVAAERFVEGIREHQPDLLGMSAMLTTTMTEMQRTISVLSEAGLRGGIGVMVGGACISQEYANRIGADCYCADCSEVVGKATQLLSTLRPAKGGASKGT